MPSLAVPEALVWMAVVSAAAAARQVAASLVLPTAVKRSANSFLARTSNSEQNNSWPVFHTLSVNP